MAAKVPHESGGEQDVAKQAPEAWIHEKLVDASVFLHELEQKSLIVEGCLPGSGKCSIMPYYLNRADRASGSDFGVWQIETPTQVARLTKTNAGSEGRLVFDATTLHKEDESGRYGEASVEDMAEIASIVDIARTHWEEGKMQPPEHPHTRGRIARFMGGLLHLSENK